MRVCVIDIGSNSVRLMLNDNGKTVYKRVKVTRLAENLGKERFLCQKSIERTLLAIDELYQEGKKENPDRFFIFATAAVREAKNKKEFCEMVKKITSLNVDVVSGEVEARLGVNGALKGKKGGIIDIGGASTEIAYVREVSPYSKSYKIGAGTLTERMKEENLFDIMGEVFSSLPNDLGKDFYGIGGTATSVAAMILKLEVYNPEVIDGFYIEKDKLFALRDKLLSLTTQEIASLKGLQKGREGVITAGVCILCYLTDKLHLNGITVSESDNLEGYLQYKGVLNG